MLSFLFRKRGAGFFKDQLLGIKTVKIKGMRFKIRKLSPLDHMAGLNVLMNHFEEYTRKKPETQKVINDFKEVSKFMRDFIYAGVIEPKITMVSDKSKVAEDEIHIDDVMSNMAVANQLAGHIIRYSYKKK